MKTIHNRLSKNIKSLLAKKKMTIEALAIEVEVDKSHMSRILSGKGKASLDLVQRVADALQVDVGRLVKG